MPKVLLIDDEAAARADLRAKLAAHPDVTVVGEAATIQSARALLAQADYDLVFLDVQLIGGESFQLVPDVRPGAHIVFATAHDRYAVCAFDNAAVDYLLKPIDPTRLAQALGRAGSKAPFRRSTPDGMTPAFAAPQTTRVGQSFPLVRDNFSEVRLNRQERNFLRQCLEAWEDTLPPVHPLRVLPPSAARAVHYVRGTESTQLYVASAPRSCARRWWRALRARWGVTRPGV